MLLQKRKIGLTSYFFSSAEAEMPPEQNPVKQEDTPMPNQNITPALRLVETDTGSSGLSEEEIRVRMENIIPSELKQAGIDLEEMRQLTPEVFRGLFEKAVEELTIEAEDQRNKEIAEAERIKKEKEEDEKKARVERIALIRRAMQGLINSADESMPRTPSKIERMAVTIRVRDSLRGMEAGHTDANFHCVVPTESAAMLDCISELEDKYDLKGDLPGIPKFIARGLTWAGSFRGWLCTHIKDVQTHIQVLNTPDWVQREKELQRYINAVNELIRSKYEFHGEWPSCPRDQNVWFNYILPLMNGESTAGWTPEEVARASKLRQIFTPGEIIAREPSPPEINGKDNAEETKARACLVQGIGSLLTAGYSDEETISKISAKLVKGIDFSKTDAIPTAEKLILDSAFGKFLHAHNLKKGDVPEADEVLADALKRASCVNMTADDLEAILKKHLEAEQEKAEAISKAAFANTKIGIAEPMSAAKAAKLAAAARVAKAKEKGKRKGVKK